MVHVFMMCVSCNISFSFQLTVYGPGHPCPVVPILGVDATNLQGEYYEEDYGGVDGCGFASEISTILFMMFLLVNI